MKDFTLLDDFTFLLWVQLFLIVPRCGMIAAISLMKWTIGLCVAAALIATISPREF